MAKRFISTELFNDSWFMELEMECKLFYIYLITNCDHAGVIDLNPRLAELQLGIKDFHKTYDTLIKELDCRLVKLVNNYYFIPKFIKFQYPKGLSVNVKAQESVIRRLFEFNLFNNKNESLSKELRNSLVTVQDKDKDIYKDSDGKKFDDYMKKKTKELEERLNEDAKKKFIPRPPK